MEFLQAGTRTLGHASPHVQGTLMRIVGNQVWKFKNKRHETKAICFPYALTGEGREERQGPQRASQLGLGMAAVRRNPGNCIDTKILIALVFFVLKFAWFLIKDSNISL
ncbi:hypothetical protein EGK_11683 [Macaca mulatta]|uniref:Uncharacterized protein n=3 Tax=Macaca TaxID=9539 RepID=F7HRB6_MACMU|nr:hypothetical protein EGK_11683 [Macaca mulatta]EHH51332.1 hypothetical protein EGM_10687 [Macaca fascicularis]BAB21922.1 hypothetical protein [Macaca fascicularis]